MSVPDDSRHDEVDAIRPERSSSPLLWAVTDTVRNTMIHTLAVTGSPVPCYGCGAILGADVYWIKAAIRRYEGFAIVDDRPHCRQCLDQARDADPDGRWFRHPGARTVCRCQRVIWSRGWNNSAFTVSGGSSSDRWSRRAWCHPACAARYRRQDLRGDRRACAVCERMFPPSRSDVRYCSAACRQRAYRRRQAYTNLSWSRSGDAPEVTT
jgi:hypothetical protein